MSATAASAINEKTIKRHAAIIDSMTLKDRKYPDLLKASRKRRVAAGSGTTVQEVNQLLKQFEQTTTMMKKFSGGGGMMKMLQNFKHLLPNG